MSNLGLRTALESAINSQEVLATVDTLETPEWYSPQAVHTAIADALRDVLDNL
jgi:hypothetical protein